MFARVKKTGQYQYLQLVQNRREGKRTIQRVAATLGRLEKLQQKGDVESLVPFPIQVLRDCLDDPLRKKPQAQTSSIGPDLIFERL